MKTIMTDCHDLKKSRNDEKINRLLRQTPRNDSIIMTTEATIEQVFCHSALDAESTDEVKMGSCLRRNDKH